MPEVDGCFPFDVGVFAYLDVSDVRRPSFILWHCYINHRAIFRMKSTLDVYCWRRKRHAGPAFNGYSGSYCDGCSANAFIRGAGCKCHTIKHDCITGARCCKRLIASIARPSQVGCRKSEVVDGNLAQSGYRATDRNADSSRTCTGARRGTTIGRRRTILKVVVGGPPIGIDRSVENGRFKVNRSHRASRYSRHLVKGSKRSVRAIDCSSVVGSCKPVVVRVPLVRPVTVALTAMVPVPEPALALDVELP